MEGNDFRGSPSDIPTPYRLGGTGPADCVNGVLTSLKLEMRVRGYRIKKQADRSQPAGANLFVARFDY
jgi:hypothetical protein